MCQHWPAKTKTVTRAQNTCCKPRLALVLSNIESSNNSTGRVNIAMELNRTKQQLKSTMGDYVVMAESWWPSYGGLHLATIATGLAFSVEIELWTSSLQVTTKIVISTLMQSMLTYTWRGTTHFNLKLLRCLIK